MKRRYIILVVFSLLHLDVASPGQLASFFCEVVQAPLPESGALGAFVKKLEQGQSEKVLFSNRTAIATGHGNVKWDIQGKDWKLSIVCQVEDESSDMIATKFDFFSREPGRGRRDTLVIKAHSKRYIALNKRTVVFITEPIGMKQEAFFVVFEIERL